MPSRFFWLAAVLAASAPSAHSEALSPWFGNEGQAAFQLALNGKAVVAAADPTSTGSISPCELPDCPMPPKLAKGQPGAEAP